MSTCWSSSNEVPGYSEQGHREKPGIVKERNNACVAKFCKYKIVE